MAGNPSALEFSCKKMPCLVFLWCLIVGCVGQSLGVASRNVFSDMHVFEGGDFFTEPSSALPDSGLKNVTEVVWSGPEDRGVYLGSPSLVRCPQTTQTWLASHDLFGRGVPSGPKKSAFTYRSTDNGKTWTAAGTVTPMYWSSLFVRESDPRVYLLGTTNDGIPGPTQIVIGASSDCGATWQTAVLSNSTQSYSTGPTPVLVHAGRLWRAFEHNVAPGWASGYAAVMLSAPVDAPSLLSAQSWTLSGELPFSSVLPQVPATWASTAVRSNFGWLEGNAVAPTDASDPGVFIMLRVNSLPTANKAALLYVASPTAPPVFRQFVEFPGGMSKFTIRFDPQTKLYVSLTNNILEASLSRPPQCSSVPWPSAGVESLGGESEERGHSVTQGQESHHLEEHKASSRHRSETALPLPSCSMDQLRYCNPVPAPCVWAHANARNNLTLIVSSDLLSWRVVRTVLAEDTGAPEWVAQVFTGFQYVDWQFDGDDLVTAVRAAYRGANCYHNSNRILVQRLVDWRSFL
eukprot:m.242403 g.242403  ORF g.242403 m.242403 type:complete len:518 (-) comp25643_c0_seq1:24-1577(-)